MRRLIIAVMAVLALASAAAAADPAEGFWISVDENSGKDTAGWRIFAEKGRLKGEILSVAGKKQDVKATAGRGKSYDNFMGGADVGSLTVVGTAWIWGLEKDDEGEWEDGYVIDPNNGKRYRCEISFHRADGKKYKTDTLEMRGKVGPFGRSQFWRKADEKTARGLR